MTRNREIVGQISGSLLASADLLFAAARKIKDRFLVRMISCIDVDHLFVLLLRIGRAEDSFRVIIRSRIMLE